MVLIHSINAQDSQREFIFPQETPEQVSNPSLLSFSELKRTFSLIFKHNYDAISALDFCWPLETTRRHHPADLNFMHTENFCHFYSSWFPASGFCTLSFLSMSNYIFLQKDAKQKKKEFQGQTTAPPALFYGALMLMRAATLMHAFAGEQYLHFLRPSREAQSVTCSR